MIAGKRDMWCALLWALGHAADRAQREKREQEALAAIIKLPVKRRVCTKADFVEPKFGPRRFCAQCGKGIHAHPKFAETWCASCGSAFGPGNHGYSACDEHEQKGVS